MKALDAAANEPRSSFEVVIASSTTIQLSSVKEVYVGVVNVVNGKNDFSSGFM